MGVIMFVTLSFVLVAGVTFAVGALLLRLFPAVRAERLITPISGSSTDNVSILRWEQRAAGHWHTMVERVGRGLMPRDPMVFARYRTRLARAGFHDPSAVALFLGGKVTAAITFGVSYLVFGTIAQRVLPNLLPISIVLGGIGFFVPDLWLGFKTRQRQQAVTDALPDVLDLLMVCVEAGMGFDAAVARIAEQRGSKASPLHAELLRMHLEIRAGRPREEALRALSDNLGTEQLRSVVGSFIQSERLGTSLGKTLRVLADASRVQRRHRAEKKAQLAPLMMLAPTVLFLLPSFMLVATAPSFLRILKIMSTIGK